MAILSLTVTTGDGDEIRFAASGTADAAVYWAVDGRPVGTTTDGEALEVAVAAGTHEVRATTAWMGAWSIHARPAPAGTEWLHVASVGATHAALQPVPAPAPLLPVLTVAALAGWRRARPKTP